VGDWSWTRPLPRTVGAGARAEQRAIQFVFQDADASLNPSHSVADIVGRPLRLHAGLSGIALRERVVARLAAVRLGERYLDRLPNVLSGGEKQRVDPGL
jgi:peptide/nickel transport system ATP-binding protein